jgi:hypothetical protein
LLQWAFSFLTARAVDSTVSIDEPGITRGCNYGNTKADTLIRIAKQLIVFKHCELQGRQLHHDEKKIGSFYHQGSNEPLPASIIDNANRELVISTSATR